MFGGWALISCWEANWDLVVKNVETGFGKIVPCGRCSEYNRVPPGPIPASKSNLKTSFTHSQSLLHHFYSTLIFWLSRYRIEIQLFVIIKRNWIWWKYENESQKWFKIIKSNDYRRSLNGIIMPTTVSFKSFRLV